jgi:hypothetical protein
MFHAIRQVGIYIYINNCVVIRYNAIRTCLYSVVSNSSAVGGIYMVTLIDPWNLEFNLSNILSSYLTKNMSQLQGLVGPCCTEKDCCLLWKWYKKHVTVCKMYGWFSVIKTGDVCSDHCALSG